MSPIPTHSSFSRRSLPFLLLLTVFVSRGTLWGETVPHAPKHPHLLITAPQWEALSNRARLEPQWFQATRDLARRITQRPVGPGARVTRSVAHDFAEELTTLAFVYRLNGEKIFLEAAAKRLDSASALATWKGDEFLDTAWVLYGTALAYDWLFDALPPPQIDRVRRALQKAGLSVSADAYQGNPPAWWVRAPLNWSLVGNGATALAAMALLGEVPEAAPLLATALSNLEPALAEMNPDGGWAEGNEYLVYSLQFLAPTLRALETTFATDFGLLAKFPAMAATGVFFTHTRGPTDLPFNFADCREETWAKSAPEIFYTAQLSGNPIPYHWARQHPDASWRQLFYQNLAGPLIDSAGVFQTKIFRGMAFSAGWKW